MVEYMKAGEFKVIDRLKRTKEKVIITKGNVSIAKLVPIEENDGVIFGKLKGTVHILGELLKPVKEVWDANH